MRVQFHGLDCREIMLQLQVPGCGDLVNFSSILNKRSAVLSSRIAVPGHSFFHAPRKTESVWSSEQAPELGWCHVVCSAERSAEMSLIGKARQHGDLRHLRICAAEKPPAAIPASPAPLTKRSAKENVFRSRVLPPAAESEDGGHAQAHQAHSRGFGDGQHVGVESRKV